MFKENIMNKVALDSQALMKAVQANGFADVGAFAKAVETIATNTFDPETRSIWSPENLDQIVKLIIPKDTPLRNRFGRVPGMGQATAWERLTSKLHVTSGGAAGIGTNTAIEFADGTAPNETAQSFVVESAAYKLLGRKIQVGGLAIAASNQRPGGNQFEQRRRHKVVEVMLGEEELIIGGDKTVNPLQFDGLTKQITTNSGVRSLLTVSGVNTDIANTVYKEGGSPSLLIGNARVMKSLSDELQGTGTIQRVVVDDQGNATGGLKVSKMVNAVDGTTMDLVTSRYVADNAFLIQENDVTGESVIEMDELIPLSQIDVPTTVFASTAFVVEAVALKVMAEPWQFKYTGTALF